MIKEIYIIHRNSGVPLFHLNLEKAAEDSKLPSALFSGALHGIRAFLKEADIGDLNEFITNENRIEVRAEKDIVTALIADIGNPSHDIIDKVIDDIGVLFISQFSDKIEIFEGDVSPFEIFNQDILEYLNLISESKIESEEGEISEDTIQGLKQRNISKPYLDYLKDWAKNRFDMEALVKSEVTIFCPPDNSELEIDLILEGNKRKLSRLDNWLGKRMYPGGMKNIHFIIELDAIHGPDQIRQIFEKVRRLGDVEFIQNEEYYPWFPAGLIFIGVNLERKSFERLDDIIKVYKGNHLIVPKYAGHIHREHTPHHKFMQCRISGWKWNLKELNSENIPIQVYP